jgi:hypothetical protein
MDPEGSLLTSSGDGMFFQLENDLNYYLYEKRLPDGQT